MGYTHYWSADDGVVLPADRFGKFIKDTRKIVEASHVDMSMRVDAGAVIYSEINDPDLDCFETYRVDLFLTTASGRAGGFCKTYRRPADEVVAASLLSLSYHFPEVRVSTDGVWENDEWQKARYLYLSVFPDRVVFPQMVGIDEGREYAGEVTYEGR